MDVDTYGEGDQVDDACGFYQSEQVWFSFTPSQTMFVGVHTQGSDFYTAVTVYRQGRNGQPRFVDCSALDPHAWVIFEARADATYLLLVQRAIDHGSGTDLVLSVVAAPPPIGVQVALDGSGIVDEAGVASMSGTVTCSTRVDDLQINVALSQSGDWDGEGSIRVACSPSTVEWVAEVHPTGFGGVLVPGPALGLAWGRACNSVDGLEFCTGFSDGEYIGGRQNILLEAKAVWTPWPEPPSPSAEPDVPPPGAATESP